MLIKGVHLNWFINKPHHKAFYHFEILRCLLGDDVVINGRDVRTNRSNIRQSCAQVVNPSFINKPSARHKSSNLDNYLHRSLLVPPKKQKRTWKFHLVNHTLFSFELKFSQRTNPPSYVWWTWIISKATNNLLLSIVNTCFSQTFPSLFIFSGCHSRLCGKPAWNHS